MIHYNDIPVKVNGDHFTVDVLTGFIHSLEVVCYSQNIFFHDLFAGDEIKCIQSHIFFLFF